MSELQSSASERRGPDRPTKPTARPKKFKLRPWLRALHRDLGYFVIGLTFIYAISGLAVNHIGDWDPNFTQIEREHALQGPLPDSDSELTAQVLSQLQISEKPTDVYRLSDTQLEISVDERKLHIDTSALTVFEEGQKPRFFLRVVNWLHLNRGKQAWTYIADLYAVILLYLATSGLFMLPGKKGLFGRGALIAGLGAAIPAIYVAFSAP